MSEAEPAWLDDFVGEADVEGYIEAEGIVVCGVFEIEEAQMLHDGPETLKLMGTLRTVMPLSNMLFGEINLDQKWSGGVLSRGAFGVGLLGTTNQKTWRLLGFHTIDDQSKAEEAAHAVNRYLNGLAHPHL